MLRTEFHCHTIYSKDSLVTLERLLAACRRKGIDRVVITDHNSIAGALAAKTLDPERVIVGEEIMTTQGELLAAYLQEEVPPGLDPLKAIECLRDQGAFISISHPFDTHRNGQWEIETLNAIAPLVDAIEVFNARCMNPAFNKRAAKFARLHDLPGTVGSDAHTVFELGKASLLLPEYTTPDELRTVIRQGQQRVSLSAPWIHFTSRYAVLYKRLRGKH